MSAEILRVEEVKIPARTWRTDFKTSDGRDGSYIFREEDDGRVYWRFPEDHWWEGLDPSLKFASEIYHASRGMVS